MKMSPAGLLALRQREGCRLTAYHDTVGVLTIGVGHTGHASAPPVTEGMTISQAAADAMLATDLAPFEAAVNDAVKTSIGQNAYNACVSLAFNIGAHGFTGSTVVHKINEGDMAGAADAFLMWEKPAELKARREEERKQFLTPDAVPVVAKAPMVLPPAPVHVDLLPASPPADFATRLHFLIYGRAA